MTQNPTLSEREEIKRVIEEHVKIQAQPFGGYALIRTGTAADAIIKALARRAPVVSAEPVASPELVEWVRAEIDRRAQASAQARTVSGVTRECVAENRLREISDLHRATPAQPSTVTAEEGTWEAHQGLDYTVVMQAHEGTDNASIQISTGDDAEDLKLAQRLAAFLSAPPATSPVTGALVIDDAMIEQAARRIDPAAWSDRSGATSADTYRHRAWKNRKARAIAKARAVLSDALAAQKAEG